MGKQIRDHNKLLIDAQKQMIENNYSEYTVQKLYMIFYDWFENKIYSYIKKTENFHLFPDEVQEKAIEMTEQAMRWFENNPGKIIEHPLTYFHYYAFKRVMNATYRDALDYTINASFEDYMRGIEENYIDE